MRFTAWLTLFAAGVSVVGAVGLSSSPDTAAASSDPSEQRVELGTVDWHRDFERARELARERDKPLFVLFTEVPGCSTVEGYGRRVLSHRLVADAIAGEFVPVAVFNNVGGDDREVLESFGEPTWNNPAVRIIRPDRTALAPRLYGDYSVEATVRTMIEALESTEGSVPEYLKLLHGEQAAAGRAETAIFGMYCFWSGEAKLGRFEGVVETRPGFVEGTEVVEVTYDPKVTSLQELVERAKKSDAASSFYARNGEELEAGRAAFGESARRTDDSFRYAPDDDNHALRGTAYESLGMTDLQTTRVNSAVAAGRDPGPLLSPGQREQLGD